MAKKIIAVISVLILSLFFFVPFTVYKSSGINIVDRLLIEVESSNKFSDELLKQFMPKDTTCELLPSYATTTDKGNLLIYYTLNNDCVDKYVQMANDIGNRNDIGVNIVEYPDFQNISMFSLVFYYLVSVILSALIVIIITEIIKVFNLIVYNVQK